jgi:DNA repair protein RadC
MPTYETAPATDPLAITIDLASELVAPSRLFRPGPLEDRTALETPEAAAEILGRWVVGLDREACAAAYLDTKHRVLGVELVSLGSIDHTFMAPRELFRGALLANASALIVAHSHPSGDPEPSEDDRTLTRRLVRAGELVGVTVLDHLVMAVGRWVSLARRGCV